MAYCLPGRINAIASSRGLRPRLPSLRSVLPSRQIAMLCSAFQAHCPRLLLSNVVPVVVKNDMPLPPSLDSWKLVRPTRSPLNCKAKIRADFFDIFGCARHNSNKFGFALACTKIREIRGLKYYLKIRASERNSACSYCRAQPALLKRTYSGALILSPNRKRCGWLCRS